MDCLVSHPLVSVPVSFLGRFGGVCQPKKSAAGFVTLSDECYAHKVFFVFVTILPIEHKSLHSVLGSQRKNSMQN